MAVPVAMLVLILRQQQIRFLVLQSYQIIVFNNMYVIIA